MRELEIVPIPVAQEEIDFTAQLEKATEIAKSRIRSFFAIPAEILQGKEGSYESHRFHCDHFLGRLHGLRGDDGSPSDAGTVSQAGGQGMQPGTGTRETGAAKRGEGAEFLG